MSDPELTRQDEEISAAAFSDEEERDRHDFGNRPEAAGVVLTLFVVWLIFAFTG
ncbi:MULTISPECIES: hypothetical protein [Phyllobacteriaceae]|uniref:hypothetical protein n=1 Tax=Phyllobacteriaceae TaxID=69277 RepID=UPI002ACA06AA|nr:hypothetical protein [Chelativorans sp. M5D2P16]MDZ5699979.1 hypothetical protein [Chelativorans sp. M5D2P16]